MPPLKKNEKVMLIAIVVVVVAFLILDPYYLWRTPPDKAVVVKKESKDKKSENGTAEADTGWSFSQERISLKEWGRDPFVQARPDLDVEALFGDLKLGVISVKGDDRMAMINSKSVRVGDEVNGLKVTSIESGRVILQSDEISYTLTWEK